MSQIFSIVLATLLALAICLLPAVLTKEVRERNPRNYIEHTPHTSSLPPRVLNPYESPWVGSTYPYRGLVEPRKDRP